MQDIKPYATYISPEGMTVITTNGLRWECDTAVPYREVYLPNGMMIELWDGRVMTVAQWREAIEANLA